MKIDRVGAILDLFLHAYFSFLPTSSRVWSQTSDMISLYWDLTKDPDKMLDLQEKMIDAIRDHPASKYPVSNYHKYRAAEWLDLLAREEGWEMVPQFRSDLELRGCQPQQFVLRTHQRSGLKVCLLEEQREQLTRGTTGLVSWQGAAALLDWAEWSGLLAGKRVVELGSGLGQFGLTALQCLSVKHLTLTDFHHNVINALDFHINLNLNTEIEVELEGCLERGYPARFDASSVAGVELEYTELGLSVSQLDWRSYDLASLPRVDMVVASDIVFARELHTSLAGLLSDLLSLCDGEEPAAYLACTLRADGMVKGFLKVVESLDMRAEIVYEKSYSPDDGLVSSHELLHPIKVIKITRSSRSIEEKSTKLSDLIFF